MILILKPHNMDELNNTYLFTSIILTILLISSELLAWSKCDANAITQLYKCFQCNNHPDIPVLPIVVITPEEWSD